MIIVEPVTDGRFQNPDDAFDADDDGLLSPEDLLLIIDRLRDEGAGPIEPEALTPPYLDVDGNGIFDEQDRDIALTELDRRQNGVSPHQNPENPFDVNGDGEVSPVDVLLVINRLDDRGPGPFLPTEETPPFLDVNGDKTLTEADAQAVNDELD